MGYFNNEDGPNWGRTLDIHRSEILAEWKEEEQNRPTTSEVEQNWLNARKAAYDALTIEDRATLDAIADDVICSEGYGVEVLVAKLSAAGKAFYEEYEG